MWDSADNFSVVRVFKLFTDVMYSVLLKNKIRRGIATKNGGDNNEE